MPPLFVGIQGNDNNIDGDMKDNKDGRPSYRDQSDRGGRRSDDRRPSNRRDDRRDNDRRDGDRREGDRRDNYNDRRDRGGERGGDRSGDYRKEFDKKDMSEKREWTGGEGSKAYYTSDRPESKRDTDSRRGRGGARGVGRGSGNGRMSSAPGRPATSSGFTGRPRPEGSERSQSAADGDHRKGKSTRKDPKWDRTPAAPRFARGGGRDGRSERGGFGDRGGSRGRGRGRGTTPAVNNNTTDNKNQQLTKQNSSDLATEEWETASENSEKCDMKEDYDTPPNNNEEKRESKKSFSSQRPSTQNRRANSSENGRGSRTANGTGGSRGARSSSNKNMNSNKKENVQSVYRVDGVVLNDPNAITNAINK